MKDEKKYIVGDGSMFIHKYKKNISDETTNKEEAEKFTYSRACKIARYFKRYYFRVFLVDSYGILHRTIFDFTLFN